MLRLIPKLRLILILKLRLILMLVPILALMLMLALKLRLILMSYTLLVLKLILIPTLIINLRLSPWSHLFSSLARVAGRSTLAVALPDGARAGAEGRAHREREQVRLGLS
jgi:hypothetical protein